MTSIATLGGPQYPDGSSGHHIPRRVLEPLPGGSSEYVAESKSESEPLIKLKIGSSGVQLYVASGPPLEAVASKAATSGGYVVFLARPGVRMLARIEGLDAKLAAIASKVESGPYALFPHQARAALAECGDDFSRLLPRKHGVVIESHCEYAARNIQTSMPSSSGLLVSQEHAYRSNASSAIRVGDWYCDCDTRLNKIDMLGDTITICDPHAIVGYRRNGDHELFFAQQSPPALNMQLCMYKHKEKCATAVQSRLVFEYTGDVRVTCTLVVWRCTRAIGSIQHTFVVPIPAEIALVWQYGPPMIPSPMYARPKEGGEWRVHNMQNEKPPASSFPANHVPFPPFLYYLKPDEDGGIRTLITSSLFDVTQVEEGLTAEFDTYRSISQAMDAAAYVVKKPDAMVALDESRSGVYADRSGSVVFRFYSSSSELSFHLPIAHVQLEEAPSATFGVVSSVLFDSATSRFTLVSTAPGSKAITCTLRVSPLSKLWPLLHTLCSAAPTVRLDASTLAAIGFSAGGAWIPRPEAASPILTMRTTAAQLNFRLPGAVADTPAPSGLASAPVPSTPTSTARVTGIPTPTTTVAVPTPTTTVAVPTPTTGASEKQEYSVLIGVAVLAVVGIFLLRARRRRRR
jgi:hypothetical protein